MSANAKSIISMIAIAVTGVSLFCFMPSTDNKSEFQKKMHENQGTLNIHVMESQKNKERLMAAIQQQAGLSEKNK